MSKPLKPRCDSKLKNLPADRQAQVFAYASQHGLVKCADWLKDDGLGVSKTAVGEFVSWYALRQQEKTERTTELLAMVQAATAMLENVKKELEKIGHDGTEPKT
jgi:hypothetical protein